MTEAEKMEVALLLAKRDVQWSALLAALDALVQDMATISGVHGVPHADASEPAMKATAYWQGRLDGLLRQHREGR